jgi:hypothetical protein
LGKYILPTIIVIFVAIVVGLYFFIDPASTPAMPKCTFKLLTGLQCPGCGSQPAIHALLHGDVAAAWRFNAMMVASIPVLAVLIPVLCMRRRYPKLYTRVFGTTTCWVVFAVIMGWWILRNIFGW